MSQGRVCISYLVDREVFKVMITWYYIKPRKHHLSLKEGRRDRAPVTGLQVPHPMPVLITIPEPQMHAVWFPGVVRIFK